MIPQQRVPRRKRRIENKPTSQGRVPAWFSPFLLRDYQTKAVDPLLSPGPLSRLAMAPDGAGKTVIFAEVVRRQWFREFEARGARNFRVGYTVAGAEVDTATRVVWFNRLWPSWKRQVERAWLAHGGLLPAPECAAEAVSRARAGELALPSKLTSMPLLGALAKCTGTLAG